MRLRQSALTWRTPSFTLVLHIWKQDLGRHIHVHALVTGGALTVDGKWVSAKRGFLFPVKALSGVYLGKFMDALDAARKTGGLRHDAAQDDASWRLLIAALRHHDWVVYAKQPLGGPVQVLEYLRRYTTGGDFQRAHSVQHMLPGGF